MLLPPITVYGIVEVRRPGCLSCARRLSQSDPWSILRLHPPSLRSFLRSREGRRRTCDYFFSLSYQSWLNPANFSGSSLAWDVSPFSALLPSSTAFRTFALRPEKVGRRVLRWHGFLCSASIAPTRAGSGFPAVHLKSGKPDYVTGTC